MRNVNFSGDYLKLFLKRESKVVFGKNFANICVLTVVLAATFFAIAFSNGSLLFLEDKMTDPFINWVDIENNNQNMAFTELEEELSLPDNAERYHYKDFEYGYEYNYFFFGKKDEDHEYLKCRFFERLNSELIEAILSPNNVVNNMAVASMDDIPDNTLGVIITQKALNLLCYEVAPAYIDLYSYSEGADALGIKTFDDRSRAPLPVLGVVKRLPGNVDIISSSRFYQQNWNDVHTFNLNNTQYAQSLCYFVPSDVDLEEFKRTLTSELKSRTLLSFAIDDEGFCPEDQFSYKNHTPGIGTEYAGYVRVVTHSENLPYDVIRETNSAILDKYRDRDVHRLYPYVYDRGFSSVGAYLSVHFKDLNAINEFVSFVNGFGVEIDMTQINAKENFNSVRLMAGVLSWAMIIFAIICILLFITNLLQSYFQKVKRNIGTFKAFGISNRELIFVYLVIMAVMVIISTIIAFVFVLGVQELLPMFGVMKDGAYNYLSLFSTKTWYAILIIVISSLYTVYRLMRKMLKCTPGDLIYER